MILAKSQRITHLLSLAFFFSGMSALIYQVVWQRLLTTYYGVGPISFSLIVTVYMLGLGFGALFGGYLAEKVTNKILTVFIIESCIGIFGSISPVFLDFLGSHTAGSSYSLSFMYMFIFLSLPTFLMGCTLPLLTKIFSGLDNDFLKSVSLLYFVNTLGAAFGSLVASYLIISFFGLDTATYIAASINFGIALLILLTIPSIPKTPVFAHPPSPFNKPSVSLKPSIKIEFLLAFVCITGFVAIGYEVIWFRVVGVLAKDSPYAFSSVLAIYLTGIAVGSFVMNGFLKRNQSVDKLNLFFALQVLIGLSVSVTFIGYFYLTKYTKFAIFTAISFATDLHPNFLFLHIGSLKGFLEAIYGLFDVFVWSSAFVLIPTILMGASFPLISLLAFSKPNQEGKTVSLVYFFTIVGNTLGGVFTGFLLLPYLGTENTLVLFSSAGITFAVFMSKIGRTCYPFPVRTLTVISLIIINIILFPRRSELYEIMHLPSMGGNIELDSYIEEGIDGVVATYQQNTILKNFINGSSHGGRPGYSFKYETIEAMARVPKLEKVLVIGYGTGTIVETLLKDNTVGELVIVELNKTLLANLRKMPLFNNMLNDSRIRLIVDDGRRYLLRTPEKFDLIAIDALRSTTAYSNNLYSAEFFQLSHDHLKPKGVFLTWRDEHKVIPKTLASVFEYLEIHKYFCLSSNAPIEFNDFKRQELIDSFSSTEQQLLLVNEGYLGDKSFVNNITSNYPINRDWKPWAEYYIGLKTRDIMGAFSGKDK